MDVTQWLQQPLLLMEGALGERLKREFGLKAGGPAGYADIIYQPGGCEALAAVWGSYIGVARRHGLPFLATTPTRRLNCYSYQKAGLTKAAIGDNMALLKQVQAEAGISMLAGGMMGCIGNAYTAEGCLPAREALAAHRWAAGLHQAAGADMIFAALIPTLDEALGIAGAISETPLPYLISFTIQRDGRLIDGTPITEAIDAVDTAAARKPVFFMTNCVHPQIVHEALSQPFNRTREVRERFRGLQANGSALSYAELDASPVLYGSPPEELAQGMLALRRDYGFSLFGGCCGTDASHLEAMATALTQTDIGKEE